MTSIAAQTLNRQPATWQAYVLPLVAVIGAPMMLFEIILNGFRQVEPDQFGGLLSLLYIVGWTSSIAGLIRLEATGRGAVGRTILRLQLVGLMLAAAWSLIIIANPDADKGSLIYQVTDTAWPLSHVFMIVVGIATLIARRLPTWQRVGPLLCGFVLPGSIIVGRLGSGLAGALVFGVGGAAAFLLLSYVARRGWQAPASAA